MTTYQFADLWEAVAATVPDRVAVVCDGERLTYRDVATQVQRLAAWMHARDVGHGDHVGVMVRNRPAYLVASLAAFSLRAVPINVNHRYVADELRYLFDDADLVGIVHDRAFGPSVAEVAADLPLLAWQIAVDDGSDAPRGTAEPYADAIDHDLPAPDVADRSNDDRYVMYTGGTTGAPKGVVWRQEDAFFACIGGGDPMRLLGPVSSPGEVVERVPADGGLTFSALPPLMHAAGFWTTFAWLLNGATIVLQPGSFDPDAVWRSIEREGINVVTVVGDAMLRPLMDAYDERVRDGDTPDTSSLLSIGSGGAPLTAGTRQRVLAALPSIVLADGYGSTETGAQAAARYRADEPGERTSTFEAPDAVVLDEETLAPIEPGSGMVGRVARSGRIPLGYHGDPEATARAFIEHDGTRYVLTGDAATVEADGSVVLLGRGSQCINTGGEKVFVEEVEEALLTHPALLDAVVVGLPDERWGERVAAVVSLRGGVPEPGLGDVQDHCRERLAGYKVPRTVAVVGEVQRSPAGKADYRWARETATAGEVRTLRA